ncbi:hypothetical protein [Pseudomonas sp. R9.37]|uniref:hypothetical protein n=1 Tax=Pseudomonas sp. R9.37 TaxID=1390498 RepID=UPI0015ADC8EC|nr:hypothetical protein [Pseudomonas sp. R9.37]
MLRRQLVQALRQRPGQQVVQETGNIQVGEVREWTGHKSIESLRTYLTKVFEGDRSIGNAAESVHQANTLKIYQKKYDALYKEFKLKNVTPDEFVRKSDELMELRDLELSRYDAKPK